MEYGSLGDGKRWMEVGGWKLEDEIWKMEVASKVIDGSWKMKFARWKLQDGSWK